MSENTTLKFVFDGDYQSLFKWTEYLIFAALLFISMGIGVFYGFFHKKNRTNEEFLMGGRTMTVFPVTLSLICSFISAITLMGNPVEVYYYGLVYIYFSLSFIPMTLAVAYLYVPVFFHLRLTSAYEYLEKRFSKTTRRIMSVSAIIHLMIYMPLTVWGPSLALDQVAGVNRYISSAVIFIVCVIYSSIGGLKAVLWTDVLQGIIMFGSMITIVVLGLIEVGGFGVLWSRATETGRTNVSIFDPDPRTRHTFWTGLIGAYFSWIPLFAGTQAQIQRYLSVPTLKDARKCLFYNMVGLFAVIFLCTLTGLLIFAKYYDCDPVSAISPLGTKVVSASDQLLPFFVMEVLGKIPTLPGILLAGLTSGTLSSVSASLNALPAIIIEDYVKPFRPGLSELKLGYLSKIISGVGGMLSFCLIFVIAAVGNILPFASLLHGTFIGPIVGLFSLGMFFPWTNNLGSTWALLPSVVLTLFFGIGSILKNNAGELPDQRLSLRTDGCYVNETLSRSYIDSSHYSFKQNVEWKDESYTTLTEVLSISYLWQPLVTLVSTVVFGLLFSFIVNLFKKPTKVKAKYMTPIILSMWIWILGVNRLSNWIDFDDSDDDVDNQSDNTASVRNSISSDSLHKGKKL